MKRFQKIISSKISFIIYLSLMMVLSASFKNCQIQPAKSIVRDVVFQTVDHEGQVFADLAVDIDLGNIMLPSIYLPIFNPYNPTEQYGEISTLGGFNGVNEIGVGVNLSQFLSLPAGPAFLPDGSPLPITELKNAQVVDVALSGGKHRIYLAADSGVAMLGFALTFKELDKMGQAIQGIDLIIPFNIGQFRGAAGFFTSTMSGKTGICVFVDLGQIIYPSELLEIKSLAAGATLKSARSVNRHISNKSILHFEGSWASKRKTNEFYRQLYKLHRKGSRLHLN